VETEPVAQRTIARIVTSTGTLEAPEAVIVTAESAGRVDRILFDEGQRVSAGEALLTLEDAQQRAAVEQAQARLTEASRQYSRLQALEGESFASEGRLDTARAAEREARAALAIAEDRLADRWLTAPFGGVLGRRQVSVGAFLSVGEPVVSLTRTDPLDVVFDVPAEHVPSLVTGMKVRATTRAYPGRDFQGEVTLVDSEVSEATRTIALEASIANESGELKAGQFMSVELVVSERRALTVPESAVLARGPVSYVYAVDGDGVAHRRVIETGQRRDGWVEVTTGLDGASRVVTAGSQGVRGGQPVRVGEGEAGAGGAAAETTGQ
jgi:membrane fusion protein (multidrug efflux system)